MEKILHVISSPRAEESYSVTLGNRIITRLAERNPGVTVTSRNLVENPPPFLTKTQIAAFYKAPEARNRKEADSLRYSDEVIRELFDANLIVIGSPMHNMGISALLKAWIDQIVRIGVTFTYNSEGQKVGLLAGKKVYLALASGRVHSNGHYAVDFMADYVRVVLKSVGITDVTVVRMEGTAKRAIRQEEYHALLFNL